VENLKLTVKYVSYLVAKVECDVTELDMFIYSEKSSYKCTQRWVFFSILFITHYFYIEIDEIAIK
jgi:hypothetical protein